MSWNLRFHPAVKKDLRRLSNEARGLTIGEILSVIARDPYTGETLHGPLKGFWKHTSGEYRVAYQIDGRRKEVIVLEIGPRGGFYERLRRRLGK